MSSPGIESAGPDGPIRGEMLSYATDVVSPQDEQRLAHAMLGLRIAVVCWCVGVTWSGYDQWGGISLTLVFGGLPSMRSAALLTFTSSTALALAIVPAFLLAAILPRERLASKLLRSVLVLGLLLLLIRTGGWIWFVGVVSDTSDGILDQVGAAVHGAGSSGRWLILPVTLAVVSFSLGHDLHGGAFLARTARLPLFLAMLIATLSWLYVPIFTLQWMQWGVGVTHGWSLAIACSMVLLALGVAVGLLVMGQCGGHRPTWLVVIAIVVIGVTTLQNVIVSLVGSPFQMADEWKRLAARTAQISLMYGSAALPMLMVWVLGWRRRA
ncbi:MAG: hypothetical protein AAF561_02770 [Planctomycetota bacterium]